MIQQNTGGVGSRRHQMFPVLTPIQVEAASRFASGPPRVFASGETVFATGDRNVPVWLVCWLYAHGVRGRVRKIHWVEVERYSQVRSRTAASWTRMLG